MDKAKHIQFERTGGFAGMRVTADFDLNDLPGEQAQRLRAMLDEMDFDELPEVLTDENPVADGFSYVITVKSDKQTHTVTTGDSGAPEKLQPLLDLLSQIARQQMRKRRG